MRVSYDYDQFTMSTGIQVRVHKCDKMAMSIKGGATSIRISEILSFGDTNINPLNNEY